MKKSKKIELKVIIRLSIFALLIGVISIIYLLMPVLSLNYISSLGVIFLISILISAIMLGFKRGITSLYLPIIIVMICIFQIAVSTDFINHESKRELIGEVKKKNFSTEISPIDLTQIPVVDAVLAKNLGEKKLGEQVALGSQVELGDFTEINVNGKLYWVSPLLHSGFFKWNSNKTGTPGYIMVSATNPQDIKLVDEVDGKNIKIKYQPNAYFGDDLKRRIYMSGHKTVGLIDYSFELDDEGKPYWIVTKYKNTIGLVGSQAIGVVIINPQNGEVKDYNINEIPHWVDRVVPMDFAIDQINDWGRLVHGWWNPSDKDIIQTTEGASVIYNNGNCYYYTGMTSSGSDESTVGFMLVNTRTKESTFYKISGSTEVAAMQSSEGKVQNLGYTATFPILINIENEPTYFTTLKDKKGLVKLYAMVNVKDYSVVGTGESLSKTKSNYLKYLRNRGDWQPITNSQEEIIIDGTVKRISSSIIDDTTYYYIILNEKLDKIFIASLNMSNELPITREGDKIQLSFLDNKNSSIDLVRFDNLEFAQSKSEGEEAVIDTNEKIETEKEEIQNQKNDN